MKRKRSIQFQGSSTMPLPGNCLPDATVYEVEKKNSALSSSAGKYSVNIPGGKAIRGLCYCKAGFFDSIVFVNPSVTQKIDVHALP